MHRDHGSFGGLRWGIQRYAVVMLVCVFGLGVLLPLASTADPTRYKSEALIIAETLKTDRETLPRYGQAIFSAGPVEDAVRRVLKKPQSSSSMIPTWTALIAEQDSVVLRVEGFAATPKRAAIIANVAAETFVGELNEAGPGVGVFALHSSARPSLSPIGNGLSRPMSIVVGLFAGVVLGVGLIACLLAVQRPVLTASDVEESIGAPLLGTVVLPRQPTAAPLRTRQVPGFASMTQRVIEVLPGRILALASPSDSSDVRKTVSALIAATVARTVPLTLIAGPDVRSAVTSLQPTASIRTGKAHDTTPEVVVIDGVSGDDYVALGRGAVAAVLVARLGIPARRLGQLAAEFVDDDILGVVLVRDRRKVPADARDQSPPSEVVVVRPLTSTTSDTASESAAAR